MLGTTHLMAGLAYSGFIHAGIKEAIFISIGSLLPDIDMARTSLGKSFPKVIPAILPHRGPTHSILFAALFYFLYKPLGIGIILHIILDAFNPIGEKLLWPLPFRFKVPLLGNIKSGGLIDTIIMLLLAAYTLYAYSASYISSISGGDWL